MLCFLQTEGKTFRSNMITTRFTAMVALLRWSGTEPTASPGALHTDRSALRGPSPARQGELTSRGHRSCPVSIGQQWWPELSLRPPGHC